MDQDVHPSLTRWEWLEAPMSADINRDQGHRYEKDGELCRISSAYIHFHMAFLELYEGVLSHCQLLSLFNSIASEAKFHPPSTPYSSRLDSWEQLALRGGLQHLLQRHF